MGLPGFVTRLSLMSPEEMAHRVAREVRKTIGRRIYGGPDTVIPLATREAGGLSRAAWIWPLDGQREAAASLMRDMYKWREDQAQSFLHHRFSFFGFKDHDFGKIIRWNFDHRNGVETPLEYGLALDYRDFHRCGDVKYVWEPSRFHHLTEMSKAYYLDGDEAYAKEIVLQVESWISQAPCPLGVHWSGPLESAVRVINWSLTARLLAAADPRFFEKRAGFLEKWAASVRQHLVFIRENFSAFSSADHRLIGEAGGLFVGAMCFEFPESREWSREAAVVLEKEALAQNHPDGVNKEQSLGCQTFVFDLLLLAGLLGRQNGMTFSESYWGRLERMAEFVAEVIDENGDLPQIGDDGEARVLRLDWSAGHKPGRSLLAMAAAVFGRTDFREKAGSFDEKAFWVLGHDGLRAFESAAKRGKPVGAFEYGGYYILKADGARLIFDCGPLGYLARAAHGHADALSFVLDYRGRPIFVDRGTYAYHADPVWRDYFRGTAAHNTVRIDGQDQSQTGGGFLWLAKAHPTLLRRDESSVAGRHDGYRRLKDPVQHEREIRFSAGDRTFSITDRITAVRGHRVERYFHLHPDCSVSEKDGVFLIAHGDARLELAFGAGVRARVLCGSLSPLGGWHSPGYDVKVPAATIAAESEHTGSAALTAAIRLLG